MSTELDLDDVAAQSPLAMRGLAALRAANERFGTRQAWWTERMFALEQERDALRAELDALRSLLVRCVDPLDNYAEYLNEAPVWHATGGEANAVNPLRAEIRAAIDAARKGEKL